MSDDRSVVDMDPDVARRLFEEGAFLVLLGVPQGTELGIDCKSWQVGPRFKGVKMIPPGLHFLHYCSVNRPSHGGEVGPKMGLFVTLKPREILLANWDPKEEDLDFSASQNEEEVSRIRSNLKELDTFLGPYPYEVMRKWVSLTDRLSHEVAMNLQPLSGRICAFSDVVPEIQFRHTKDRAEQPRNDTACQSMKEGLDKLPRMKQREGTQLRFSAIPERTYPPGATPAEITRCSLDLSYALDTVLQNYELRPLDLLGLLYELILNHLNVFLFPRKLWNQLIYILTYRRAAVCICLFPPWQRLRRLRALEEPPHAAVSLRGDHAKAKRALPGTHRRAVPPAGRSPTWLLCRHRVAEQFPHLHTAGKDTSGCYNSKPHPQSRTNNQII